MQDALLQALDRIQTFHYGGKGSLYAWISRIAINKAVNDIKRRRWRMVSLDLRTHDELPEPADETVAAIPQETMLTWIARLPDLRRAVFNLYCIDGFSHKEIAGILGISEKGSAALAGLAAVLLLHRPGMPDEGVQSVRQQEVPVVAVTDSAKVAAPVPAKPLVAQTNVPEAVPQPVARPLQPESITQTEDGELAEAMEETVPAGPPELAPVPSLNEETVIPAPVDVVLPDPPVVESVALVPPVLIGETVKTKENPKVVLQVIGATTGSLLTAAVTTFASYSLANNWSSEDLGKYYHDSEGRLVPIKETDWKYEHGLPLRFGLSFKVPISDRLGITTGFEYAQYTTKQTLIPTGAVFTGHKYYVGVPVRLDWSLFSSRWLDVYVGGGMELDMHVRTSETVLPNLSLIGAGGIQFNMSRRIGIYVEPMLNWAVPFAGQGVDTYRREQSVFSVATGLRVNLGKTE